MNNKHQKTLREVHIEKVNKLNESKKSLEEHEKRQKQRKLIIEYKKNIQFHIDNFERLLSKSANEGIDLEIAILDFLLIVEGRLEVSLNNKDKFFVGNLGSEDVGFGDSKPIEFKFISYDCEQKRFDLNKVCINKELYSIEILDDTTKLLYQLITENDFVPRWFVRFKKKSKKVYGYHQKMKDWRHREDGYIYELCLRIDSSISYKEIMYEKAKLAKSKTKKSFTMKPIIVITIILLFLFILFN